MHTYFVDIYTEEILVEKQLLAWIPTSSVWIDEERYDIVDTKFGITNGHCFATVYLKKN